MSSDSGRTFRRIRGTRRGPASLIRTPEPVEPIFLCEKCRREFPITERSRVARGRCRACV